MEHIEVTVIGAGLAGLTLVEALVNQGLRPSAIALVDPDEHVACTSRNLGAIQHPFVGRAMALDGQSLEVWRASLDQHERWARAHPAMLRRAEMVRPIDASEIRQTMRARYLAQRHAYPEAIAHRLMARAELTEHAHLRHLDEAIVYGPGYVVDLAGLLDAARQRLCGEGLRAITARLDSLDARRGDALDVRTSAGRWRSDWVILTIGVGLLAWFPGLGLRQNWGELLRLRPAACPPPLEAMISARGYLAPMPDGSWVLGSTYLREGDLAGRDEAEARAELLTKGRTLSPWVDRAEVVAWWRGSRLVHPGDRYPVAGFVPQHPRLGVLGGLGSKGLLWSPWLARELARLICSGITPKWGLADRMRLDASGWTALGGRIHC